ncbi:hypothetical protein FKP32DRAFT_1608308 [Trametes sanguinea]|nr:hypothetical protein FKP32DRAFT_1608308 [Trametes sanguinea]
MDLLSVRELEGLIKDRLAVPRDARRPKDVLLEYIRSHADNSLLEMLQNAVLNKQEERHRHKRSLQVEKAARRVRAREEERRMEAEHLVANRDGSKYMIVPTEQQVHRCYQEFYNATSAKKLECKTCAICGRECAVLEDDVKTIPLCMLPNTDRLRPCEPHPCHDLYDGCLLEPSGVEEHADGRHLYPKVIHKVDLESLHRSMRGTVTTYELSTEGVVAMLEGRLMPRPMDVLASVLSITFVGRGSLPKNWLRTTFRYYGNITVSDERLRGLPDDDVPEEVMSLIRQCTDEELAMQESAGYVPEDDSCSADAAVGDLEGNADVLLTEEADVLPLNVAGVIDTDLSTLSASELMRWGLANLWNVGSEGGYAIRHSGRPVGDFRLRPHAETAERRTHDTPQSGTSGTAINQLHARTDNFYEKAFPCLFPYGRGGIEGTQKTVVDLREHVQWALRYHDRRFRTHETFPFKREALASARQARAISTITLDEEAAHLPPSNPTIRVLKQLVYGTAGRIWSTSLIHGPPSVDTHDPIAQIMAGAAIDIDHFLAAVGPSSDARGRNIAHDPYAAAKFFHFMIDQIVETPFTVRSEEGVLGPVSAYIGAVETQGRGCLHLHMLLWLPNTPSPDEEFRQRNIRAYLPGLESAASTQAIPKDKGIAFSRPPDPTSTTYANDLSLFECERRRCLFPDAKGKLVCKRQDYRLYRYMNSWCPSILINARCNNDIKLLTNGRDTKNITFYKQGRNYNMSAVLASGFAYDMEHQNPNYAANLREKQRLLLFRLVNAINRQQELAAPMVMSYLMGWGDVKTSHTYSPLYWSSFAAALCRAHPSLLPRR